MSGDIVIRHARCGWGFLHSGYIYFLIWNEWTRLRESLEGRLLLFRIVIFSTMSSGDTVVSVRPYFKIQDGKKEDVMKLLPLFYEQSKDEPGSVHYEFSFADDGVHFACIESYVNSQAVVDHLTNILDTFGKLLEVVDLLRLEIHATPADVEILKSNKALADAGATFFTLDGKGWRKPTVA